MTTYSFYKMSPSGNTTVLIKNKDSMDARYRALISNKILDPFHLGGEQVGVVSYLEDSTPRLDMMGGEFLVMLQEASWRFYSLKILNR